MIRTLLAGLMFAIGLSFLPAADDRKDADGYVSMFKGKDLTGWVPVNVDPETFFVKDGMIITTGFPTGTMRTERQYENFVMEADWMHVKNGGNSGIFVWGDPITAIGSPFSRGIEVQVLDGLETANYTSQGDLFSIWGAKCTPDRPHPAGWERCLPSERRTKPAGEWNHYKITANDGAIKLEVNGKEVSGVSKCNPRKGYICLESEGSECRFKNLRIKELPSTNAKKEETALVAEPWTLLYNGLNFRGWKWDLDHTTHWKANDYKITYDGKSDAKDKNLWTANDYQDFVLMVDWRLPAKPKKMPRPVILPSGDEAKEGDKVKEQEVEDSGDSGIYLRGSHKAQVNIWCWPIGSGEVWGYRTDKTQPAEVRAACTPKVRADKPPGQWNRFLITLKGETLNVNLNGKDVIVDAKLPGIPKMGPIGLQHHGDPVEFSSLFIRELK
jgi:hypothetical protein